MENFAVVVHYAELALKGQNRPSFENRLLANIRSRIKDEEYERMEKKSSRIIIRVASEDNARRICEKLRKVFGIKWLSPALSIAKDMSELEESVVRVAERYKQKKIKIETRRVDKKFPLTSLEINKKLGEVLEKNGFLTEIKKPDARIFVEVLEDEIIIAYDRTDCEGGLPVGSSGRVLCLFSGGIDSPVAAWLMMKRGCVVDLLHVHGMPDASRVKESKIERIREKLSEYAPERVKLYLAPYDEFYANASVFPEKEEAIMFRRFIVMVANEIAKRESYLGLVMGDNLGQVASQTLENIAAVDEVSELPIYRPLITMDKEEIVQLAQKIGTYEMSIEKYKDCCSLVAHKHPSTRARRDMIADAEKKLGMENIVKKTLEKTIIV